MIIERLFQIEASDYRTSIMVQRMKVVAFFFTCPSLYTVIRASGKSPVSAPHHRGTHAQASFTSRDSLKSLPINPQPSCYERTGLDAVACLSMDIEIAQITLNILLPNPFLICAPSPKGRNNRQRQQRKKPW